MESIKDKAKRGVKYSIIEKGVLFILGLIQLGVVVRYIDKSEIGLMAILNTILAFANIFSELGIGNSLLHHQDATPRQLSSVFWWQILTGLIVYILVAIMATPIGVFYESSTLEQMLYILGSTILIASFGQCHSAILYRDLHFKFLSTLKVIVTIAGFLVVVILAMMEYGLWALVIGALVKSMVQSTLLFGYGKHLFSPSFHLKINEIRPHIKFGIYQTGERVVNLINSQLDTLIIGKYLGQEVLGIYDVIKQLLAKVFRMVNAIITSIMLPIFAKFQADRAKTSLLYLRQINYLSSLNFPIYLFIAFNASAVFLYLLNPNWLTPTNQALMVFFCWYFILYSTQNPLGTILIANGRVKQSFWYNLVISLFLPPMIFWGAQTSLLLVVQLLVISQALRVFASYYYLLKPLVNFSLLKFSSAFMIPLGISLISISGAFYLVEMITWPLWAKLLMQFMIAIAIYFGLSTYWNREFLKEIIHFAKHVMEVSSYNDR